MALIKRTITMFLFLSCVCGFNSTTGKSADMNKELVPPCPDSPNCVSSLDDRPGRSLEPFPVRGSVTESLQHIENIISSLPRTLVAERTNRMIRAEFRTILGFVDDVVFAADDDMGVIQVRSASRIGYWDLGVNRRRVERIRVMYLEAAR